MNDQHGSTERLPDTAAAPTRGALPITALATDCDRTLTGPDLVPDPEALAAIARLRTAGVPCFLVTGRSKADLERHPALATAFDGYALEGGAVWGPWDDLIRPSNVDVVLAAAGRLEAQRVTVERRSASFGCSRRDLDLVRTLAGDCSIQVNVDRLDVLPPRLDKGTGLDGALGASGLRAVHVIAIGDGENDLPMLERASVGLAVANAVPALKAFADEVLDGAGPAGLVGACHRILRGDWSPKPAADAASPESP